MRTGRGLSIEAFLAAAREAQLRSVLDSRLAAVDLDAVQVFPPTETSTLRQAQRHLVRLAQEARLDAVTVRDVDSATLAPLVT